MSTHTALLSRIAAPLITALLMGAAHAHVTVEEAWVRATVPAQQATAAFMQITASHDMRLLGAKADVGKVAEVHTMEHQGDVMHMKRVEHVDLPAGKTVSLTPGGLHLMLMGLDAPVQAGQTVTLTLLLEDAANGKPMQHTVQAPVHALTAPARSTHAAPAITTHKPAANPH